MHDTTHTNRLIHETSPYLLQHAHNPVDWYPWNRETLQKARRENKPILLSIGYSACHWCHVMAHESFEDEETARVMNEHFINVKVDREERPDLDKIYQTAHQLLNRRGGGWPLTMFLTPDDQVPFFGGTYFPKEPRYGMPAFKDLLQRLMAFYRSHQEDIRQQNASLLQVLSTDMASSASAQEALDAAPLQQARDQLIQSFDPVNGGFGQAPKFPQPVGIERLMRHWAHSVHGDKPDRQAAAAVRFTLRRMALGGLYDHLGGGFCRYSVDEKWMIPHFEKMLYDNGPLLGLYSEAWRASGESLFKSVAEETGNWVIREMQAPEGGYYSTLDADSEGEEGKYYVWTREQVKDLLSDEEYALFAFRYNLDQSPNFEGRWHLQVVHELDEVARRFGQEPHQIEKALATARNKLFRAREQRIRPGRDEKILTAWNGLMIKGMAIAARHLGREDFLASAERSLDFIRKTLWRDGRLKAVYKDGQAHLDAYLDDYAFLVDALLELLQVRWRAKDLDFALELTTVVLDHFRDRTQGGFFFTADDHEQLIQRPKPVYDESLPTGNGIMVQALIKLWHLTGVTAYEEAAESTLRWARPYLEQIPVACNTLLSGLEIFCYPPQTVILRGQQASLQSWLERCAQPYAPGRFTVAIPTDGEALPGLLAECKPVADPVAYVCTGTQCSPPVTALQTLEQELATTEASEVKPQPLPEDA